MLSQNKFIRNKDVDRKILNQLNDKDLVNFCAADKKANSLCNDQVFWMNRVYIKFPEVPGDILRKNKDKYWHSWSEYYIKDLRKINHTNADDELITGSKQGRLDHVIISLKEGANIHGENDVALRLASRNGHIDVVKYLVELKPDGANIHTYNDDALRRASLHGHLDIVKYLVSHGANIHGDSDAALRWASKYGQIEVVKYLVELKPDGANIHPKNDESLKWAKINGHLDIVKYLISAGAN